MVRFVLSQICKNESHCITTMLNSLIGFTDMVVFNDTGSTDGTQDIIKKWGIDNNIPAYVFERNFDNFENSRNFALQMAIEMINKHGWDRDETYTHWLDCDETIVVDKNIFNKQNTKDDLLMITAVIGNNNRYTRNTFVRASKSDTIKWHGIVHEYLAVMRDSLPAYDIKISSSMMKGVYVDVKMIGASWKGDIAEKYKEHSVILEKYINNVNRDPRWIFYTAQSYHDSSAIPDNRAESEERLRRSLKYYRERVSNFGGYEEERFYSQLRIGTILNALEEPWHNTHQELLKAYSMDPMRGEPMEVIIKYYLNMGEFNLAYIYTKFAKVNFHGKNPYPARVLFIDEALYMWRFLDYHMGACAYTNRLNEAKSCGEELKNLIKLYPQYFTEVDVNKINSNIKYVNQ